MLKVKYRIILCLFLLPQLAQAGEVTAPTDVAKEASLQQVAIGKITFGQVCSHCHFTSYEDKFAPGMAGIAERVSPAWLDEFLKNPGVMMKKDEYARQLRESNLYSMTMPAIPAMLDDAQRQAIIAYISTLE